MSESSTCLSICLESCTKVRKCSVMLTRLTIQSFSKIWGEILTFFILLFFILLSYYQLNFRLSSHVFIFKKIFYVLTYIYLKWYWIERTYGFCHGDRAIFKTGRKKPFFYPIFNVDCPPVCFQNNVHIWLEITISAWSDFI